MLHTFLIDTHNLAPEKRLGVEERLRAASALWGMLASDSFTYFVHTSQTFDEFMSTPFPDGCTIRDTTGRSMM